MCETYAELLREFPLRGGVILSGAAFQAERRILRAASESVPESPARHRSPAEGRRSFGMTLESVESIRNLHDPLHPKKGVLPLLHLNLPL